MKKIIAATLQEAITQASIELGCSVTELDYEVVQSPSKGFFGIGKKDAIIVATILKQNFTQKPHSTASQPTPILSTPTPQKNILSSGQSLENSSLNPSNFEGNKSSIDESFFKENEKTDSEKITQEIQNELKALFASMPYKIDKIEVGIYDPQTLLITLDGEDSALMIGEKGYRYKALSYLLFNWIHPKYGYNIRLEIAQFLKNQEEAMDIYLQNIITTVYETGKAQTKPLDGVLAYIALKKLRDIFPNKYVSFRTNTFDERYIIVSDFIRNE
ncbi:hypothetical protein BKH41_03575 [Helicobacter sp. 12S02232-10]|uniref:Jag N-terminal domain-containing protein n=1 Tax=Helicobacter sp. 12S02232-10 TaxID=1476197 RepID=UPI000BA6E341|nr:Jag N-terminal domain-containing protein [Helicobacter sp. 12S02232-10]PAF49174.1 hypothetical protein BKH41_03575 [Helicobacter sp. 12S02232-10]